MLLILLLVVFLTHTHGDGGSSLKVTVKQGILRGYRLNSLKGRDILAFQGIPYAKPPVEDLRFRVGR
jgi:carboxylesterase type B